MSPPKREFELIDWIRRRAATNPATRIGIGDDTALVAVPGEAGVLVTVDMIMDGVHFQSKNTSAELIGRKALAVNLSDIAAMAGTPTACVVSFVLPRDRAGELGTGVMTGIAGLADRFGVAVVGGDTNVWDGPMVISITVLGDPPATGAVLRSGAQVGDAICVTGTLGGSLTGRHLTFEPRVKEAAALAAAVPLHAMIDLSDGLVSDLGHILEESNVGAEVELQTIPISHAARGAVENKTEAWQRAVSDGEDFELLFTLSQADCDRLLADPPFETAIARIGTIVPGSQLAILDAHKNRVTPTSRGWEHTF